MRHLLKNDIVISVFIFLVLFPIVFIKLNSFPIKQWDEAMFATNAYEMLQKNELIVPYYNGEMDMLNSKPPLMIWAEMASIKMFGYNEFAIRLPAATSVTVTFFILFFFLRKRIDPLFAWISILVLVTSQGFLTFHTGRTGDADAMLTLLLTSANIIFIDSVITNRVNKKRILLFFIFISLAFLCKSFAALLFGLGYLIVYFIYVKKKYVSPSPKIFFIMGLFLFLIVALSFVLLRNYYENGYLTYILSQDIGRMTKAIENHNEPFAYYIENLAVYNFRFWFMLSVIGMLMLLSKSVNEKIFRLLMCSTILLLSYFIVISISVTKVPWYAMPLYPLFAITVAVPIYHLLLHLNLQKSVSLIFIFIIFVYPYNYAFGLSQSNPYSIYEKKNESCERYIFNETNENKFTDSTWVLYRGYERALKFYEYKLKSKNLHLLITDKVDFFPNNIVIVSSDSLKYQLKNKYNCLLIDSAQYVCKYKILSIRSK